MVFLGVPVLVGLGALHCNDPEQDAPTPVVSQSASAESSAASAVATASASSGRSGLSQGAIDAVVARHRDELRAACATELERASQRTLSLFFEVDTAGVVTDATAAGGGSTERPLRQCIEKRLGGWKFPAPDAAQTITAMIDLSG